MHGHLQPPSWSVFGQTFWFAPGHPWSFNSASPWHLWSSPFSVFPSGTHLRDFVALGDVPVLFKSLYSVFHFLYFHTQFACTGFIGDFVWPENSFNSLETDVMVEV